MTDHLGSLVRFAEQPETECVSHLVIQRVWGPGNGCLCPMSVRYHGGLIYLQEYDPISLPTNYAPHIVLTSEKFLAILTFLVRQGLLENVGLVSTETAGGASSRRRPTANSALAGRRPGHSAQSPAAGLAGRPVGIGGYNERRKSRARRASGHRLGNHRRRWLHHPVLYPRRAKVAPCAETPKGPADMVTTRERVLAFVTEYAAANGYGPTMVEIAAGVGVASKNAVAYHLNKLEQAGHIKRQPQAIRGLEMLS